MEAQVFPIILGVVSVVAAALASHRWVSGRLEDVRKEASHEAGVLHERVNKVQAEYVRKDDLMEHIKRIEKAIDRMNERLDRILGVKKSVDQG